MFKVNNKDSRMMPMAFVSFLCFWTGFCLLIINVRTFHIINSFYPLTVFTKSFIMDLKGPWILLNLFVNPFLGLSVVAAWVTFKFVHPLMMLIVQMISRCGIIAPHPKVLSTQYLNVLGMLEYLLYFINVHMIR